MFTWSLCRVPLPVARGILSHICIYTLLKPAHTRMHQERASYKAMERMYIRSAHVVRPGDLRSERLPRTWHMWQTVDSFCIPISAAIRSQHSCSLVTHSCSRIEKVEGLEMT